jgi:glucosamine--fructose-6-phosphate aminotransferase (isomerizing)
MSAPISPLLAPTSPLDERSRELIRALYARETNRLEAVPIDTPLNPVRRRRVEITRDEILGQPQCIRATLAGEAAAIATAGRTIGANPPSRLYLTGCGDSLAVMIALRPLLEEMFGAPVEPIQALELAYYASRPIDAQTLVIGLSSSGETPRTVEAMLMAKALGAQTITLSNTPGSTLMREADRSFLISAQRKGWPTQASTAAMALLTSLALAVGASRGVQAARIAELTRAFEAIPEQIASAIAAHEPALRDIARAEAERAVYLFSGGGPSFAGAFFGAAKVKECTPDHALAIPLEEYHHYTSQKAGDPLFLIAPNGLSVPRALDTAREGRRVGGQVYVITANDNATFDDWATHLIRLPPMIERLSSMVYSISVQLFAYHLGIAKFERAERAAQEA